MKAFAIIISFLMCFNIISAQSLDSLKHVEIVTSLQDSMALINKSDIDIINKAFYERDILDSLSTVNDTIIRKLELAKIQQDSILSNYRIIVQNDSLIKTQYGLAIEQKDTQLLENQKSIKKQKTQKTIWQSVSGGLAIALIVILCL